MIASLFGKHRALPIIRQAEASECGLACLAMISTYHGRLVDLTTLRRDNAISVGGATVERLMEVADRMQLRTRPLKLELAELKLLQLPAILHWDLKHFVVLKSVSKRKCVIHDPAIGLRTYTLRELSARFTGIALEVSPGLGFKREDIRELIKLQDLFVMTRSFYPAIAQIFALSFLFQLASLFMPFYLVLTLDLGLSRRDNDWLLVITIAFLLVNLSKVALELVRSHAVMYFTNQLGFQIGRNVFHHMIRLPLEFFERRNLNELVGRFDAVGQLKDVITKDIVGIMVDGMFSCLALTALFFLSPTLAAIALIPLGAYVAYRVLMRDVQRQRLYASLEERGHHQAQVMSTLRTMRATKLLCNEQKRLASWQNAYMKMINAEVNADRFSMSTDAVRGAAFAVEHVLTVYIGWRLVNSLALTPGQLMGFIVLKQQFITTFGAMIGKVFDFKNLRLQLARMSDIALEDPEHDELSLRPFRPELSGALSLNAVDYTYRGQKKKALENINIELRPGDILGLHGPSGSGKSTLLKLMTGMIRASHGTIAVDGTPLAEYGVREYRSRIAGVFHSNAVAPGSIAYNIALQETEVDMDAMHKTARLVQIHDYITSLPMGYQTPINDLEAGISAGQLQRIMLARAMYRCPKILFLDEAMSNLEDTMARQILRDISALGTTIVIASHSIELLSVADRVIMLDNGRIAALPLAQPEIGATEPELRIA